MWVNGNGKNNTSYKITTQENFQQSFVWGQILHPLSHEAVKMFFIRIFVVFVVRIFIMNSYSWKDLFRWRRNCFLLQFLFFGWGVEASKEILLEVSVNINRVLLIFNPCLMNKSCKHFLSSINKIPHKAEISFSLFNRKIILPHFHWKTVNTNVCSTIGHSIFWFYKFCCCIRILFSDISFKPFAVMLTLHSSRNIKLTKTQKIVLRFLLTFCNEIAEMPFDKCHKAAK